MKLYGVKIINPVAKKMLQQRKSPQIVESKKKYDRNKKRIKKDTATKIREMFE
jgi:hypothetical protein